MFQHRQRRLHGCFAVQFFGGFPPNSRIATRKARLNGNLELGLRWVLEPSLERVRRPPLAGVWNAPPAVDQRCPNVGQGTPILGDRQRLIVRRTFLSCHSLADIAKKRCQVRQVSGERGSEGDGPPEVAISALPGKVLWVRERLDGWAAWPADRTVRPCSSAGSGRFCDRQKFRLRGWDPSRSLALRCEGGCGIGLDSGRLGES
jgi:hypothetical protein